MLRSKIKKFRRLLLMAKLAMKASRTYGASYYSVFSHALALYKRDRFEPDEAFRLGLFDPNISDDDLSRFMSRKKMTKIQQSLNPLSWEPLLKNKGLFYRYCMSLGAAIPELYGIFMNGTAGWCFDNSTPASIEDWISFFETKVADEFVMKPCRGAFGGGAMFLSRDEEGFINPLGKRYTAEELYSIMASNCGSDGYVIQEQLRNHSEIIRLTGTEQLQTARFTTYIDVKGNFTIIHGHFKIIAGDNLTDTFDHGRSGNLQALIRPCDGVLGAGLTMDPKGSGIKKVDVHPKTGASIVGFRLPLWDEACSLVEATSRKFLPLRTIGWDVVLTGKGPVIVEGNFWWDPPNHHQRTNEILDALGCSGE